MSSLLTNTSAFAALQTLRSLNSGLQETQGRISSGLRVQTASENAAYWSIATTMRSDSHAVSAVSDALGLGSAKVDTAYTGMTSVIDVLSEFKAKLVAAEEDGVDKSKVQDELDQLKQQAVNIASASSFNGQNWLNTKIMDLHDDALNKSSVTSAFVRNSGGGVAVQSTEVDLSKISLFNSTGFGLLQADAPAQTTPTDPGTGSTTTYWVQGYYSFDFSKPMTFAASDSLSFDLVVHPGGGQADVTIPTTITQADVIAATSSNTIAHAGDLDAVLNSLWYFTDPNLPGVGYSGQIQPDGSEIGYGVSISARNVSGEPDSGIEITNVISTLPGGANGGLIGNPSSIWRGDYSTGGSPSSGSDSSSLLQIGLLDIDITTTSDVDNGLDAVEVMLKRTTAAAATLGSLAMRIGMQMDFASKLEDSIDSGVGRLVDADMEEEASKLAALQTQQQLAIQALSIANSAPQTVVSLFRQ